MPRDSVKAAAEVETSPVLAVGLGRGGGGKSSGLAELAWRARAQGREVIVADGDARSKTLSGLFPDAIRPETEELEDVKTFLTGLLNWMVKTRQSAVLDLGGGDRSLVEFGRDLRLVEFCKRQGVEPVAFYFLGPDPEDLAHVVSLWRNGAFRPERAVLVLNEGVIRSGRTVAGAFAATMKNPDFLAIVEEGARPMLMNRLPVMDSIKSRQQSLYAAAAGMAGLDPVEEFQVADWVEDLEAKRVKIGVQGWLP